jgi:hypothetical protein
MRDAPAAVEVRRVHDDQTFASAPKRVARHLPKHEAQQRLQRRFAIVNFWRPIGDTVQRTPLAMCDARSIIYSANRPSTQVTHEPPTRTCPSAPTCTLTRPSRPTRRPWAAT